MDEQVMLRSFKGVRFPAMPPPASQLRLFPAAQAEIYQGALAILHRILSHPGGSRPREREDVVHSIALSVVGYLARTSINSRCCSGIQWVRMCFQ
mmetsp:Transcript_145892/g.257706  ORF Transcript_145892/g.257706 Transcript_145892/m.257706 type:complete len:95 (-) Transcript_145892:48-332(-)